MPALMRFIKQQQRMLGASTAPPTMIDGVLLLLLLSIIGFNLRSHPLEPPLSCHTRSLWRGGEGGGGLQFSGRNCSHWLFIKKKKEIEGVCFQSPLADTPWPPPLSAQLSHKIDDRRIWQSINSQVEWVREPPAKGQSGHSSSSQLRNRLLIILTRRRIETTDRCFDGWEASALPLRSNWFLLAGNLRLQLEPRVLAVVVNPILALIG